MQRSLSGHQRGEVAGCCGALQEQADLVCGKGAGQEEALRRVAASLACTQEMVGRAGAFGDDGEAQRPAEVGDRTDESAIVGGVQLEQCPVDLEDVNREARQ